MTLANQRHRSGACLTWPAYSTQRSLSHIRTRNACLQLRPSSPPSSLLRTSFALRTYLPSVSPHKSRLPFFFPFPTSSLSQPYLLLNIAYLSWQSRFLAIALHQPHTTLSTHLVDLAPSLLLFVSSSTLSHAVFGFLNSFSLFPSIDILPII